MADSDTRLETLEDEVKVLKGEVKRTLVDLRAMLMKENSPLGEGSFARRSAMANQSSNGGRSEKGVTEVATVTVVGPTPAPPVAEPAVVGTPAPAPEPPPEPGPAPSQVPAAQPVPNAPQIDPGPGPGPAPGVLPTGWSQLAASPPQAGAGPGPGSIPGALRSESMAQPPPAGTGPSPDLAGLAEQERRMADQERRIAEQERRMLDRERQLTEAGRRLDTPPRQGSETPYLEDEAEHPVTKANRRNGRSRRKNLGMPPPPETAEAAYHGEEVSASLQDIWDGVTPAPSQQSMPLRQYEPDRRHRSPVHPENSSPDLDRLEMKQLDEDGFQSHEPNGRRVSVYDEYRELLQDVKEAYPIEDSPAGPPMDVNLLSSLVHWASLAKQQVGEQQLKDILELYVQSGHSRPELQELLLHLSDMVDETSMEGGESADNWVDLMFHLHGILTGGLPVVKIPQMKFVDPTASERGSGS